MFKQKRNGLVYERRAKPGYQLEDNPHVYGRVQNPGDGVEIMLIGEAPGATEEQTGEPFTGASGKFLNYGLGEADIYRPVCWTTNTITHRPPGNKYDSYEAQECFSAQEDGFWSEINDVVERFPIKVILVLGANAMHALGIEGSITQNRGSVYRLDYKNRRIVEPNEQAEQEVLVLPTFHPSYIMQKRGYTRTGARVDLLNIWQGDLRRAKEISLGKWRLMREDFSLFS